MNNKKQQSLWLCKLGFHKFESVTKIKGYVDTGEVILRNEETQIKCTREGCNKINGHKSCRWVEFKKE